MAVLTFLKGPNQGTSVELNGDLVVLGRKQECQVWINVPTVSKEHAVIRQLQGKFYIEDNKSRNGTFLNNKEVTARTQLRENDRIKICDIVLAYNEIKPRKALPEEYRAGPEEEFGEEDTSTVKATFNQDPKNLLEAASTERLALLLDISTQLSQTFNVDNLLPKIIDNLFQVFRQADRGFIILSEEGKLIPRVNKTRRADDEGGARFSRRIVNRCIETGECLLSEDATTDGRFDLSQSISDARIRSMMCAPLINRSSGRPFGVIQLDTQDKFKSFNQDDLKLLFAVAGLAAAALENARLHENLVSRAGLERDLKLARDVQKSFLPKSLPKVPGYEFYGHYEPAQEVGGDYYDFIPLIDGKWGVMIGDVAGKGVPAALMMAKVRAEARFCILTEESLAAAITKLNEHMEDAGTIDRFVTFGAAVVDPRRHQVTFANAGHFPPRIYRKAKQAFELGMDNDLGGFPLGVVQGIPYEEVTVELEPGDVVFQFTDGVSEAVNKEGKEFTIEQATACLKDTPKNPKALVECLVNAVKQHAIGCKQFDDITVVAFGRMA